MSFTDNMDTALPQGWRPHEGDMIVGRVVLSTEGWSDESGSFYPILVVHDEKEDKDVAVHAFHTSLQTRLATLQPKNGERIAIKMGPKVPLKSNAARSVQEYVVKIEGRDESVDWNRYHRGRTERPPQEELALSSDLRGGAPDDIPY